MSPVVWILLALAAAVIVVIVSREITALRKPCETGEPYRPADDE